MFGVDPTAKGLAAALGWPKAFPELCPAEANGEFTLVFMLGAASCIVSPPDCAACPKALVWLLPEAKGFAAAGVLCEVVAKGLGFAPIWLG